MNITLLNVTMTTVPTAKGSYQKADIAYKNNSFGGKVEGKAIMSFGAGKPAFDVLSTAQPGGTYEVTIVKNEKGYNDWVAIAPAGAVQAGGAAPQGQNGPRTIGGAASAPVGRSNYETPEERAQRQVSIVRQSSLSNAVATLSVGAKKLEPADVIKVAKQYEDFVHGRGASGFEDIPDFPAEIYQDVNVN